MFYEKKAVALMNKYPAICDLRRRAQKRLPLIAKEYLETGTDRDEALDRNIQDLAKITYKPRFLKGEIEPGLSTNLFGQEYAAPFGIAPVGLTGLMWPNIEVILAKTAAKYQIPFCLSTVSTSTPELVGPHANGMGWFQLYTPREKELAFKILDRAKNSGFHTLVITIDIPTPSRRQRTKRAGLQTPPKITPFFIWQALTHPAWTMATLRHGLPKLRMIEDYSDFQNMMSVGDFMARQVGGNLSWDYVQAIRDYWKGPVLLKGIMHEADAYKAADMGFDGIVVSNHGGRQFDGAPSSIDVLPKIVAAVKGRTKILFDSGVRTGLDVVRALSMGADFVLCGRAFIYGVAALSKLGGEHAFQILKGELSNNMIQLGISTLEEVRNLRNTH